MSHTYTNLLTHVIFSTKDRAPIITAVLHDDLLAYLGGIVRELGGALRTANARPDHVHLLCSLPPTVATADALRVVKTNSSRWVHRNRRLAGFDWQTGYGAFSVSHSLAPAVARYIGDQEKHHRRVTFQEELITFLKKISPRLAPWATIFRPLRRLAGYVVSPRAIPFGGSGSRSVPKLPAQRTAKGHCLRRVVNNR
jgi:REP element-mobilizing transposase RayT